MSALIGYCDALVQEISDYRDGEITIDRGHVLKWVNQFEPSEREFVASQTTELMKNWYATKEEMQKLPEAIAMDKTISGGKAPSEFWKNANILTLQERGSSQADVLSVLDDVFREKYGFATAECGSDAGPAVYVDDGIFSGQQVKRDLENWIIAQDVRGRRIVVITLGCHQGGYWYATNSLRDLLRERGCTLTFFAWYWIENRLSQVAESEVLWPTEIQAGNRLQDEFVELLEAQGHPPKWRPPSAKVPEGFRSEEHRQAYEHIMLRKGLEIRGLCRDPDRRMKPLGYTNLWTPGFGALLTTHRNCPNNAPLAWWWGDPNATSGPLSEWHPLLPRRHGNRTLEILRRLGLR